MRSVHLDSHDERRERDSNDDDQKYVPSQTLMRARFQRQQKMQIRQRMYITRLDSQTYNAIETKKGVNR